MSVTHVTAVHSQRHNSGWVWTLITTGSSRHHRRAVGLHYQSSFPQEELYRDTENREYVHFDLDSLIFVLPRAWEILCPETPLRRYHCCASRFSFPKRVVRRMENGNFSHLPSTIIRPFFTTCPSRSAFAIILYTAPFDSADPFATRLFTSSRISKGDPNSRSVCNTRLSLSEANQRVSVLKRSLRFAGVSSWRRSKTSTAPSEVLLHLDR